MTDETPEQLQLPLEMPTYDHYTIKLSKGLVGDLTLVRSHTAVTVDDAMTLIEGLRDSAANRDNVTWQSDEVDARGILYGLAPGGAVFEISVFPPLGVTLS